ncbi:MAG: GC-type dockerin domain-anchored protein [Phycisphaerales bacterium]|jgi:hypothetical protein
MPELRPCFLASAALLASASCGLAQTAIEWASAVDGDFGVPTNWSPAFVPGVLDTAVLGRSGPYVVSTDGGELASVEMPNAEATLGLDSGRTLVLTGAPGPGDPRTVSGTGTLVVNREAAAGGATLILHRGTVMTGVIRLNGFDVDAASLRTDGDGPPPVLAGVVSGRGQLQDDFALTGSLDATGAGDVLRVDRATIVLSPTAIVRANAGGAILLTQTTMQGGVFDGGNGGGLDANGGAIADAEFLNRWIMPHGARLQLQGLVDGGGTIVVNDRPGGQRTSLELAQAATIEVAVVLNGPEDSSDARLVGPASGAPPVMLGEVTGAGQLVGRLELAGRLAPSAGDGSPDSSIGTLVPRSADHTITATARTEIDVAGTADDAFDRIAGQGTIRLGGTLAVAFADGFAPAPGDRFEIVSATSIEGTFDAVDLGSVGSAGPAHLVYAGDSVTVVACAADRDGDGELTIFDFLGFQNQFDAGDAQADLDRDGLLTIFDFLAFQNRFDAGCG